MSLSYSTRPIIYVYLFLLATVFDYFTIDNLNIPYIAFTIFGMIVLTLVHYKSLPRSNYVTLLPIFLFMIITSVISYDTTRWISLFYSLFFIVSFSFYMPFVEQYLTVTQFRSVLKFLFYVFFAGLIIGQLQAYFNFFTPLADSFVFLRGSYGYRFEDGGIRFFSFSSEPSYAAFIVIAIFYSYLKLSPSKRPLFEGENLLLFVMLLYMIMMFRSAYGVLLLGLLVFDYVDLSSTLIFMLLAVAGILGFLISNEYDIRVISRVVNVLEKIDLTDPHSLFAIDFTAYYRLAPILRFIETADWTDLQFLIGHGAGSSRYFVVPEIYGGYINGEFLGGFLPAFFYDYGILGGILVISFLLTRITRIFSFPTAVIGLMLLNANFNTQLFWLLVICFAALEYYKRQRANSLLPAAQRV